LKKFLTAVVEDVEIYGARMRERASEFVVDVVAIMKLHWVC